MPRIAHVDDAGKVVNVILADDPAKAPPPPAGLRAVVSEEADIGLNYDVDTQKFSLPAADPATLMSYARHQFDAPIYVIQVPMVGAVTVNSLHMDLLRRAASAATTAADDPNFRVPWPVEPTGYVLLTGPQVIALNSGIHDMNMQRLQAHQKAVDDIKSGKVRHHMNLEASHYNWPKRHR